MTGGAQQQLDAAIAAEAWEDAAALQEELTAAAQQAAALAAAHGFQAPDAADLTQQLAPPAAASASASASAEGSTFSEEGEGLDGISSAASATADSTQQLGPAAPAAASASTSSTAAVKAEGSTAPVPTAAEIGEGMDGRDSAAVALRQSEEQLESEPAAEAGGEPTSEAMGAPTPAVRPAEAAGSQHAAHQAVALNGDAPGGGVLPPSPSTVRMEDGYVSGSESSTSDAEQPLSTPPGSPAASPPCKLRL